MRKSPYYWGTYGGIGLGCLLGIGALAAFVAADQSYRNEELFFPIGFALIFLAFLASVVGPTIALSVLVYKMWSALPAEHRRTGPGAAVGFLFIPFFNLYWVFQAYPGYVTDYNAYVSSVDPDARRLSEGPFITLAVLSVISAVPYIGVLAALPNIVVVGIVISAACDAVGTLRALPAAAAGTSAVAEPGAQASTGAAPSSGRGSIALGIFALVLILWPLLTSLLSFVVRWTSIDYTAVMTTFRLLGLLHAAIPIVMGFFVRNLGLRIAVFVLGGLAWIFHLYTAIQFYLDERWGHY